MIGPKIRIGALVAYFALLTAVQWWWIDTGLTPNENTVWFYSGLASLLFGSQLLNPYFTPPADALTNAFAAFLALVPAMSATLLHPSDITLLWATVSACAALAIAALLVILLRPKPGEKEGVIWQVASRAVRGLGSPHIVFTAVVIVAVWLFHRDDPVEVFAILATLAVVVIGKPIESVAAMVLWLLERPRPLKGADVIGLVAAHQSPGIVLVRQADSRFVESGTALVISDHHGPAQLGVTLNYVGRDEGNLLRVLTATLPASLKAQADSVPLHADTGVAALIAVPEEAAGQIPALRWINRLCGIVDVDSSPQHLQLEVIGEKGVQEGALVEVRVGDQRQVIYQVTDGVTREEIVQQKNKYGYARAQARKIGVWDPVARKFEPVSWMPKLNAPVFMLEPEEVAANDDCVGRFPATPYGVRVNVSEMVTHNTAVLGILGVGKSYLSIELVERMIAEKIKVLCLDLTNQYETLLEDFLDVDHEAAKKADLVAAGAGGAANQNKELGGSRNAFVAAVVAQMREFLGQDDDHYLRILNPAQFRVTKQVSGWNADNAAFLRLTASEITAIFSDAALLVCQELGMTDHARLCLVYEEAHSLVPEWNSVASEGDKAATAKSARAILQGRKFGLGCLLITQRTANVTKTILNQCNTIFAMRTFDDTGKEFLGNYIGSDYAGVLPSLQPRHAVVFGKASSCENPVLIRLNDQDDFRRVFRAEHEPRRPVPVAEEAAAQAPEPAFDDGGAVEEPQAPAVEDEKG